ILIFILILMISLTSFIFDPLFKYVGAVAVPIVGAGILYYLTKPLMLFFEKLKINRIVSILLVFFVLLLLGFLFVIYIVPIAQNQFENLVSNIPKMVKGAEDLISLLQSNQIVIPEQINEAIESFMNNIQSHVEDVMS